ncbi:unnamed protein product, partial [Scytosiphon promiscuus]
RRASTAVSKSFLAVSGGVSREWLRHEVGEERRTEPTTPAERACVSNTPSRRWVGRRMQREDLAFSNMGLADEAFVPATSRYLDACHHLAESTGTQEYARVLSDALEGGLTVPVAWVKRTLCDVAQAREAHERTSSGGDVWVCVDRLCGMSRDLVVVCPASNEADPLHISAEFDLENHSGSGSGSGGPPVGGGAAGGAADKRSLSPSVLPRLGPVAHATAALPRVTCHASAAGTVAGGGAGAPRRRSEPSPPPSSLSSRAPFFPHGAAVIDAPDSRSPSRGGRARSDRRASDDSYENRPKTPPKGGLATAAPAAPASGGVMVGIGVGTAGRASPFATATGVGDRTWRGGMVPGGGYEALGGGGGVGGGGGRGCVRVTVTTEMSHK